jgi:YcaO-like protein with predicted kinase domain
MRQKSVHNCAMLKDCDVGYKQMVEGSHRTRSPLETLGRVLPLKHQFGITRVANVTGLDRIGIPVVLVTRPNSRSVAVSQGKGITLEAAKASAVMEGIELWHAENIIRPMIFASSEEIDRYGPPLDVARLPQIVGSRYSPDRRFHWTEGFDILSGERLFVPHEMVHASYTHPALPGEGCFPSSTNGLASGNHPLEAICHGIYEIIERDALTVWNHLPSEARDATGLDPASIDCGICAGLINSIERAGLKTSIWDVTSDVGVATFLCLIVDPDGEGSHVGLGSGTHPVREIALSRALTEAAQTRMNYITGSRDDLQSAEFTAEGRAHLRHATQAMVGSGSAKRSFTSTPTHPTATLREDLDWMITRLQAVGIGEIACVDLSQNMADISIVRIVIPGLEAPHDDNRFVAGPRALAASHGAP